MALLSFFLFRALESAGECEHQSIGGVRGFYTELPHLLLWHDLNLSIESRAIRDFCELCPVLMSDEFSASFYPVLDGPVELRSLIQISGRFARRLSDVLALDTIPESGHLYPELSTDAEVVVDDILGLYLVFHHESEGLLSYREGIGYLFSSNHLSAERITDYPESLIASFSSRIYS